MKTALYIILASLFLLSCSSRGSNGTHSGAPAEDQNGITTGIKIGERAPELVFESPTGENISLSSLRGKMVLIDFWAAWCPPCRKENPNLVKTYHQYKDKDFVNGKGFTIYGVSLDRSKEAWIAAIEKDTLVWESHVSDLQYWQSAAAAQYGVMQIPASFLIDGNGIILAKDLKGEYLGKKLKELLK
jgi:peroxiredoxin